MLFSRRDTTGGLMRDWFRQLSPKRRRLIVSNALLAPLFVAAMTAFVITSTMSLTVTVPFALLAFGMGIGGFIIAWKMSA